MVCDGFIDQSVCKDLLSLITPVWPSLFSQGKTLGGVDPVVKQSEDCVFSQAGFAAKNIPYTDHHGAVESAIVDAYFTALSLYRNEYRALYDWMSIEDTGFQVQKYHRQHGHYREHVDSFPGTSSANRVAAGIIYLNTVEHGGETAFPLHDVKVAAVQGRIVLFPAVWTHPHEGRTPLSDDKWIINTFFTYTEQTNTASDDDHFDPEDVFEWTNNKESHGHEDHQH